MAQSLTSSRSGNARALRATVALVAMLLAVPHALAQGGNGQQRAQEAARAQVQGNLDQALTLLNEALQDTTLSNDRRAVILSDRGALHARLNQPKAAIDDFNRAVQLAPEYPAIYNNRGSTLLTLGLAQEAIKDFERAILLAPGYVAAYNNRAGAYMALKQPQDAIRDYTKAIQLAPDQVAPLNGRGRAMLAVDRPQAAARDFSRAVQTDARFALGYRNRAQARIAVERFTDAIEDLSRASAFEPTNWQIFVERGQAYMAAGNVAAAIKDYSRALEIQPNGVRALEARALAHVKLDAQDEAEADILRALELDQRSGAIVAIRAVLYLRTDQLELARKEIDKAARLEPDRAEVLWAKGEVEEALGRHEDAVASYRQALAQSPALREAADALSRLGASAEGGAAVELAGLGTDGWKLMRRGNSLFAVSSDYPRLQVPLEPVGEGTPRLLEYELKKAPYQGIALLRFSAGQITSPSGVEDVEQVAVLDLAANAVLATIPHRQGPKKASWTWDESKLTVAGVDGITDEILLKGRGAAATAAAGQKGAPGQRPGYAPPTWLPGDGTMPPPRQTAAARPPSRPKPKTLFDILFGN